MKALATIFIYSFLIFASYNLIIDIVKDKWQDTLKASISDDSFIFKKNCVPHWEYSYSDNIDMKLMIATEEAIKSWEKKLNNPDLFTRNDDSLNIIKYGETEREDSLGQALTYHNNNEKLVKFEITIDQDTKKEYLYRVLLHELGHAIGIDGHLDNPDTIMHKNMSKTRDLTNKDILSALSVFDTCAFTF